MPAGKCHSLETAESHKFSNKHECLHVLRPKGSARPRPEGAGRGQAKHWHRPGQALPEQSRACDTACPGTSAPGTARLRPPTPRRPGVRQPLGTGPLWPRRPVPLTRVCRLWCSPAPSDSGSHAPRTLCPVLSASLSARAPYPQDTTYLDSIPLGPPHCWDPISLGLHTPGNLDLYTRGRPHPHASGTPYPCDLLLPAAPIPTSP